MKGNTSEEKDMDYATYILELVEDKEACLLMCWTSFARGFDPGKGQQASTRVNRIVQGWRYFTLLALIICWSAAKE